MDTFKKTKGEDYVEAVSESYEHIERIKKKWMK